MKKQFGLTLMALLTAFSGMAFAAQGNEVNSVENSNSTTFLTDSEMKDVTAAYKVVTALGYNIYLTDDLKHILNYDCKTSDDHCNYVVKMNLDDQERINALTLLAALDAAGGRSTQSAKPKKTKKR